MAHISPLCYFPTRIILIDDDQNSLKQLQNGLNSKITSLYEIYDNPIEALEKINYKSNFTNELNITGPHHAAEAGLETISQEINNTERYQTISTIVVDYNMPEMNGLEFCEKLTNPHIQKILLTGAADESLAVKAFNKGIINHFVQKHSPTLFEDLESYIESSQHEFFSSLYRPICEYILLEPSSPTITDPLFLNAFTDFLKSKKITEYFIHDSNGNYVCIYDKTKTGFFINCSEDYFEYSQNDLANLLNVKEFKQVLTDQILKDIKNKEKVFYTDYFLHYKNPIALTKDTILGHILPLHKINGTNADYYWFFVPNFDIGHP